MMSDEKCVFCEIYRTESRSLYENNAFWTTLDKNPVSERHASNSAIQRRR